MTYEVRVPIVGYSIIDIAAEDEEEAKKKAPGMVNLGMFEEVSWDGGDIDVLFYGSEEVDDE